MTIPRVLVGIALLILGRKAFWLFVGGVGFVLGMAVATRVVRVEPYWIALGIALIAGLLGALLALYLQQVAVGVAGFLVGGYLALNLVRTLSWDLEQLVAAPYGSWLAFIAGGILCAVLVGALFEWALIALSSITGAYLISQVIQVYPGTKVLLFAVLAAIGIVIQAILLRQERMVRPEPKTEHRESTWR
jgi:hypothetical protein